MRNRNDIPLGGIRKGPPEAKRETWNKTSDTPPPKNGDLIVGIFKNHPYVVCWTRPSDPFAYPEDDYFQWLTLENGSEYGPEDVVGEPNYWMPLEKPDCVKASWNFEGVPFEDDDVNDDFEEELENEPWGFLGDFQGCCDAADMGCRR